MIARVSFILPLATRTRSVAPQWRFFTTAGIALAKPLPPRKVLDDGDLEESFLKGSGPGGQKINKTNSAVQLKHLPTGIVIKCQETRSRTQNRKLARRLLNDRLEELELGDQSRTALKRDAAAKKKASKAKKARRKYRKLEGSKEGSVEEGEEDEDGTDDFDDDRESLEELDGRSRSEDTSGRQNAGEHSDPRTGSVTRPS